MKRGRPRTSPWRKMAVGDSVFVSGRTTSNLKGCVNHLKPLMKFKFKQLMKDGTVGVRVWRIA